MARSFVVWVGVAASALVLSGCSASAASPATGPTGEIGGRGTVATGARAETDRVIIDARTKDPVQVLVGALEQPNRIVDGNPVPILVELCVDINMTGRHSLVIKADRSLIASPACARGPRRVGPRIWVTDQRGSRPLFEIQGDNVQLSGFRLEGPTSGIAQGDAKEIGIQVSPMAGPDPIQRIEISNMEILYWSGSGIGVQDNVEMKERGRLFNTNEGAVRIKGNYIHHNRHGAGFGYGVVVGKRAYALIEQNVFDENRHAIAGGSKNANGLDYSGYTARDNLILAGGGLHCSESEWLLFWNCSQTHQIDMHGDGDPGHWNCGTAGETIIIERNTILYTGGDANFFLGKKRDAIRIRGNPTDKAVVDGNVFKHRLRSEAIAQKGACGGWGDNITKPIDVRPNNQFGIDPTTQLGSCDFVGDGQQDQFMATGVTWWAKSQDQWRYLNTMPERLPRLQLGDFDNDGKCDVAERSASPEVAPRRYSKSGTGPWVSRDIVQ